MQFKTEGLILKEQTIGESDRLVTVLTRDQGVLRAFARRAKNLKDSKNAATQLLSYSRLKFYQGRDKYIIGEAFPIEVFFDLRKDILRLTLAQYFCQLSCELVPEMADYHQDEAGETGEYLRLVLNALHFLCGEKKQELLLKAIVELRMLTIAGYMPQLVCCAECAKYEDEQMFFKVNRGTIYCRDCYIQKAEPCVQLSKAALTGMRHIVFSDFDKIFSFSLSPGALSQLCEAAQAYTLSIVEHSLTTLDFFTSLLGTVEREAPGGKPDPEKI